MKTATTLAHFLAVAILCLSYQSAYGHCCPLFDKIEDARIPKGFEPLKTYLLDMAHRKEMTNVMAFEKGAQYIIVIEKNRGEGDIQLEILTGKNKRVFMSNLQQDGTLSKDIYMTIRKTGVYYLKWSVKNKKGGYYCGHAKLCEKKE